MLRRQGSGVRPAAGVTLGVTVRGYSAQRSSVSRAWIHGARARACTAHVFFALLHGEQGGKSKGVGFGAMSMDKPAASPASDQKRVLF